MRRSPSSAACCALTGSNPGPASTFVITSGLGDLRQPAARSRIAINSPRRMAWLSPFIAGGYRHLANQRAECPAGARHPLGSRERQTSDWKPLKVRNKAGLRFAGAALAKIIDALHAGRIHLRPRGLERTRQIDGPAPGLNHHGGEAEPARIHSRVTDAKVGREFQPGRFAQGYVRANNRPGRWECAGRFHRTRNRNRWLAGSPCG